MFIWAGLILVLLLPKHFLPDQLEVDAVELLESSQNVSNFEVEIGEPEKMLPGN